jgi:UDP-N-acetylglucosamine:LPS N-acetylglucosamine transferase
VLADGILAERPAAAVEIADGLLAMGWPIDQVVVGGSQFGSKLGNIAFEGEYWLASRFPPTRSLTGWLGTTIGGGRLLRRIEQFGPDVIVSTYPGVNEVCGRLRAAGRLSVPLASAITDLAALRYWAHPDVDLHLVIHAESAEEIASIAPGARVVCVRGLTDRAFESPRDPGQARRALDLPPDGPIALISGGGWAVGDLDGAVTVALSVPAMTVVCLCGRNEDVRTRLEARFAGDERVRVLGFTDRMSDLLAGADVLVHSTAGLTVLEAIVRGCPPISYGWGRAHIRANNRAYVRFGLAEVAATREELGVAIRRALRRRPPPDDSYARLPSAATEVLALAGGRR